jgi:vitamin B12 transporter
MKNGFVIFIISFFYSFALYSQLDSTKQLNEVVINAPRSDLFNPGLKIIQLDSSFLSQFSSGNLSEALSYDGTIALKQYGPGGLTSIAFRGASSSQTTVVWNGFNIQNPMYGMVDLNLFPVSASDNISIQYGAGTSQWGSGAVSGAIVLENKPMFNSGWNAGLNSSFSSFKTYNNQLFGNYGNEKISIVAKAYYNTSENNFTFKNTALPDSPIMKQQNGEQLSSGGTFKITAKIKSKNIFDLNLWYNNSFREIPPLMVEANKVAFQKDKGLKVSAEWKRIFEHSVLKLRTGFFNDLLNYNDSLSGVFSNSNSTVSVSELEHVLIGKKAIIQTGLNSTYSFASSDGYAKMHSQWRNSLYLLCKIHTANQKVEMHISLRKEMVDNKVVYPSLLINNKRYNYEYLPEASMGFDAIVFKWLRAKANASTIYRVPTLNDLYWNPGGNANLKPEEGSSEEFGLNSVFKIQKVQLTYDITVFNRNIRNWIIWLPGDTYWSPENIMKVWSRGFEHVFSIDYKKNKFALNLGLNYTYTISTNEKAKTENDESLNKQLIYVPVHEAAAKFRITYDRWFIFYMHAYTGYRYTSTDNKEFLPEYDVARVSAGKTILLKRTYISFSVFCNNMFNEEYQSVLWHAMPGRSYGLTLKLNLKQ